MVIFSTNHNVARLLRVNVYLAYDLISAIPASCFFLLFIYGSAILIKWIGSTILAYSLALLIKSIDFAISRASDDPRLRLYPIDERKTGGSPNPLLVPDHTFPFTLCLFGENP